MVHLFLYNVKKDKKCM